MFMQIEDYVSAVQGSNGATSSTATAVPAYKVIVIITRRNVSIFIGLECVRLHNKRQQDDEMFSEIKQNSL